MRDRLLNSMRHWAWVVVFLYGLILVALTCPVMLAAFATEPNFSAVWVYQCWPYWSWIGVMVLCQAALLSAPVAVASGRPVAKRSVVQTAVASGLMMGLLVLGAVLSLTEFMYADKFRAWALWSALGTALATWLAWSVIFFKWSRAKDAQDLVSSLRRQLFRGSILELLIAVPTHILARHRNYCCAGFLTFMGIAMGISVMFFAFGPAVFYLCADRWKRLHSQPVGGQASETLTPPLSHGEREGRQNSA